MWNKQAEDSPGGASSKNDPTPQAEALETEPETQIDTLDHVPEMTFDKEMNFLLPDVSWLTRDIITEEATG